MTAGSGPQSSLSFSTKNQPVGYTFDPSGNMTVEPLSPPNNMTYDGENRMTAFSGIGGGASYSYDGNGMRVVKSGGGTTTVSIFSGSSVIAEYDNNAAPTSPSREYIYNPAGGSTTGLLAMISGGATTYYHQDNLSVRLTTDGSGSILTQDGTYPFGESWYQAGTTNKWIFTSYQRDSESGLDYALARYYDSRTGTFLIPDPLAGNPADPQSWNRYPYGRDNPIMVTDPSGQSWLSDIAEGLLFVSVPLTGGVTLPLASEFAVGNNLEEAGNAFSRGDYLGGALHLGAGLSAAGVATSVVNGVPASGGAAAAGQPMSESLGMPHGWEMRSLGLFSAAASISQAAGLPGTQGCEFGACVNIGESFQRSSAQGQDPFDIKLIWGTYGQLLTIRFFNWAGKAWKDIDFHGHNGQGPGNPHMHDWDWNKMPPRQPPTWIIPIRIPGPIPIIIDRCYDPTRLTCTQPIG